MLYVIECRKPDGSLDFADPQPERAFGVAAITGITEERMATRIYDLAPVADGAMTGQNVAQWPALIDPRWVARVKTW